MRTLEILTRHPVNPGCHVIMTLTGLTLDACRNWLSLMEARFGKDNIVSELEEGAATIWLV